LYEVPFGTEHHEPDGQQHGDNTEEYTRHAQHGTLVTAENRLLLRQGHGSFPFFALCSSNVGMLYLWSLPGEDLTRLFPFP